MITAGRTYKFKIEARNTVGYSLESEELSILAAVIPGKPSSPITQVQGTNVVITWSVSDDGAAPITGYLVKIRQYDGVTFTQDTVNCDGTQD